MTRIGITSMQRIFNYGSSLQSYSLKRMLEESFEGVDVSFIDYRAGLPLVATDTSTAPARRVLAKVRAATSVQTSWGNRLRFLNHKRRYGNQYFSSIGVAADSNYDSAVDLHVIGSDEVFNCVQANPNVGFSRDLFGHSSSASRLISYAASFGNTTLTQIDQHGIRSELSTDLKRFGALSVRDQNSADIIRDLTGIEPAIHVDPVLAYENLLSEPAIPKERLHAKKFIIYYGYPGRFSPDESAAVEEFARNRGADILCFGGIQHSAGSFVDCSPFELLAYFRDAEAVVTDTFHGTILSMINGIPFATLVRPSSDNAYGNEQKLLFLLNSFDLLERKLSNPKSLESVLTQSLSTAALGHQLSVERDRARRYLSQQVLETKRLPE